MGTWAATGVTPLFYNHDSHRYYEIGFMYRTAAGNPGSFDATWCGDLTLPAHCPSTRSLTFNTPVCTGYYSDTRDLSANHVREFANTFVATSLRASNAPAEFAVSCGQAG